MIQKLNFRNGISIAEPKRLVRENPQYNDEGVPIGVTPNSIVNYLRIILTVVLIRVVVLILVRTRTVLFVIISISKIQ